MAGATIRSEHGSPFGEVENGHGGHFQQAARAMRSEIDRGGFSSASLRDTLRRALFGCDILSFWNHRHFRRSRQVFRSRGTDAV